jgi:hypothetical protein
VNTQLGRKYVNQITPSTAQCLTARDTWLQRVLVPVPDSKTVSIVKPPTEEKLHNKTSIVQHYQTRSYLVELHFFMVRPGWVSNVTTMADQGSTPGNIRTVSSVTTSRSVVEPTQPPFQTALEDPPHW